jgi:hypothetical protein
MGRTSTACKNMQIIDHTLLFEGKKYIILIRVVYLLFVDAASSSVYTVSTDRVSD